ncbi:M3 family metallopeptidase [Bacillus salacetis]|uniref:M3 family metallopeptidase n=1 Tax=Bacillus salacetis TaxID=2315464 RepID=UPI003B9EC03D
MCTYQQWDLASLQAAKCFSRKYIEKLKTKVTDLLAKLSSKETNDVNGKHLSIIHSYSSIKAEIDEVFAYATCLSREDTSKEEVAVLLMNLRSMKDDLSLLLIEVRRLISGMDNIEVKQVIAKSESKSMACFIEEMREHAQGRLPIQIENVIEGLAQPGVRSWARLRQTLIRDIQFSIKINGKKQIINGPRALHLMFTSHPDPQTRKGIRNNFDEQIQDDLKIYSQAINEIVRTNVTLQELRGQKSVLTGALERNRLTEEALLAMKETFESNLHKFTPYFKRKAVLIDMDSLSEVDLLANLFSDQPPIIPYEKAVNGIIEILSDFSSDMGAYVKNAINNGWVDAENRDGKSFIQFHCYFPISKQSRIMLRYNNDFQSLSTLAHELGHGYHSSLLSVQSVPLQDLPLTIAETASTFSEMIVSKRMVSQTKSIEEEVFLLDEKIKTMITYLHKPFVHFLFLKELYEKAKDGQLNHSQLNELMEEKQKFVYQDSLNSYTQTEWISNNLFWLTDKPFYNYQYCFGYLFSAGLCSLLENDILKPEAFSAFLQESGFMPVEELAQEHLGVDLKDSSFWQRAIDFLVLDVERFLCLTEPADD